MTRIEEIVKEAKHREKEEGFTQIVRDTKGIYSAYGIGFLEGAEWGDRTMLDRVYDFIIANAYKYGKVKFVDNKAIFDFRTDKFIEDLRKAMEE